MPARRGRSSIVTQSIVNPIEQYRLADLYLSAGDPRNAVRLLEELVAAPADDEPYATTSVRLLLARAYFHSAQLRRAAEQFQAVLAADPTDHYARFALGRTLERQSRPVEALRQFRIAAALADDPEYDAAVTRLAS
jgi:tetratricopeptide (TPR) repeat protein